MFNLRLITLTVLLVSAILFTAEARSRRRRGRHHHHFRSRSAGRGRGNWIHHPGRDLFDSMRKRTNEKRDEVADSLNWFESDLHNPFLSSFFTFGQSEGEKNKEWWQGPNICEKKIENVKNTTKTDEDDILVHYTTSSQECDLSESAYKCRMIEQNVEGRREVTLIYECCHGYSREKGDFGCPQKLEMNNIIDVAKDLNLTEFLEAVKMLDLAHKLEAGNFTVFAPVNGAFGLDSNIARMEDNLAGSKTLEYQMDEPMESSDEVFEVTESELERTIETLQGAILAHMVEGTHRSSALNDEQVLKTGHNEGSTIRINYFSRPAKLMTANCVPVVSRDNIANNGVIHSIDKALTPVTENLLELVKKRPELSLLKTVLAAANYIPKLEEDGQFTLLAPTNDAFKKMNRRLRERLLSGDQECVEKLLLNHLLPNVICSAAFQKRSRTANLLKKYLKVVRSDGDKLFVNDAQVVYNDIMGLNGVIHVIDNVLVPEEALDFLDILERKGLSELITLIEISGLTETLSSIENVTFLAPTNEAIKQLPLGLKSRLMSDKDMLKKVLTYHISPSKVNIEHYHNNQLLSSLEGRQVRLNRFSSNPFDVGTRTAQCAPIEGQVTKTCNGNLNLVSKVMLPPVGSVIDVLVSDKRFTTLMSYLKKADLVNLLQQNGPFTLLAPNNEAFDRIDKNILENMLRDPDQIINWMKMHIIKGTLCCAGISRNSWFGGVFIRALSGNRHRVTLNRHGKPSISHTEIVKCDRTATNGNVLEMEDVLFNWPMTRERGNPFYSRGFGRRNNRRRMLSP